MMKCINYIIFFVLITLVSIFDVNADCSFEKRKELLSKANNIEAYFEPDVENNKFKFYLYNLDNDLYVNLESLNNSGSINIYKYQFDTEFYVMDIDNVDDVIKYKLNIYSNNSDCYGYHITTKNIKKGAINKFYNEDICRGIEEYKYCVPVLNNKFAISDEEVINRINQYKKSLLVTEEVVIDEKFGLDDLVNLLKVYWYIPVCVLVLGIIIVIIMYINKKRGEL